MKYSNTNSQNDITILAIESSCDETSAAILVNGKVLSNIIATQSVHQNYGGVVPELASRAHQQNIIPVVEEAFHKANIKKSHLNAVAFTSGPGLLGALMVGTAFAKSLAWSLNIPILGVNHMHAHLLSHFIKEPFPQFPYLCLTVSGGHTQIVQVNDYLDIEVLGETRDDAAGEAFDKTAKMLDFPYPGGPYIDRYAQHGNPLAFLFPITEMEGFNYSFSGIKTAFLYFLREKTKKDNDFIKNNIHDICASIQYTIIKMLIEKLENAALTKNIKNIALAGGVAANKGLRKGIQDTAKTNNWDIYIPDFEFCTDNAAMVALTAYHLYKKEAFFSFRQGPNPRLSLTG